MSGHLLLADGTRLAGTLHGAPKTAIGWLAANTGVVGFQEMATDPAYKDRILAFTYPEIGSVGVAERFSESSGVQIAGMVVKALSEYTSHYLCEQSLGSLLAREAVPCLGGIDTRGLAVHLRENGEMPAAIVPSGGDLDKAEKALGKMERPKFVPPDMPAAPRGGGGELQTAKHGGSKDSPTVAVVNLGIRRSRLEQLGQCCRPVVFPYDADADAIMGCGPAGILVSDGPGAALPPQQVVANLQALLGRAPMLACGLGHVALGMALGCEAEFLTRGHHGANYPLRNVLDGRAEVTHQRHTVTLGRESVTANPEVQLVWENMTDQTVEGIRTADGSAIGLQAILAAPRPGAVNSHILEFVEALK